MASNEPPAEQQYTIHTERFILRLADLLRYSDCQRILQSYIDQDAGKPATAQTGVTTIEHVLLNHELHAPRTELCTLAPPPRAMFLLAFLRDASDPHDEGEYIGVFGLCFRRSMPYPDLGHTVFSPYQRKGYATEGARSLTVLERRYRRRENLCRDGGGESTEPAAGGEDWIRKGRACGYLFWKRGDGVKSVGRGFVLRGMEWREGLWIRPRYVPWGEEEGGDGERKEDHGATRG